MSNPFVWEADEYQRDYNIIRGAFEDAAHFLSRNTGDDYDTCLAYVKKTLVPGGEMGMKDPTVKMLHRDNGTDRERGMTTFTQYIKHVQDEGLIMAPTMTAYIPEDRSSSLLAEYVKGRIDERKIYKKQKFDAGQAGDVVGKSIADSQQGACKIDANSLSGAHNSEHSVLYVKSAHSTLTSTCRSATSYANANNEKFIQGNRHYWRPDTVYSNIATLCSLSDMDQIDAVLQKYGLAYPTVDQTMACIVRSTEFYWTSEKHMAQIRRYVEGLTQTERAAFVYTGDLYHLAIVNPTVVREMFDRFIKPPTQTTPNPDEILNGLDDDIQVYLSVMMQDTFRGRKYDEIKTQDPSGWQAMGDKVAQIVQGLVHYESLIKTFWASPAVPASIAVLPNFVRRSVVAGDTDSTIFTVQWWVQWYKGRLSFDQEAYSVGATVVYFASQIVIHLLAMMSANMGVARRHLFLMTMKNEFCFPVFTPTNRSKHYYAFQLAQEGNVFKELGLEIKGAELRSAQTPASIKKLEIEMIEGLMYEIINKQEISATEKLMRVALIEHLIRKDIKSNGSTWFRTRQVKAKETYSNPYSSIWQYYEMWNEVFGPKYGEVDEPPYLAVSFKVAAKNKTEIQDWLLAIEDVDTRARLEQWLSKRNKTTISEIMLPIPVIDRTGVPDELVQGANLAKVIYTIMSPFYIILETLGFYYPTKPYIRLVSDDISKEEADAYFKANPQ